MLPRTRCAPYGQCKGFDKVDLAEVTAEPHVPNSAWRQVAPGKAIGAQGSAAGLQQRGNSDGGATTLGLRPGAMNRPTWAKRPRPATNMTRLTNWCSA